MKKKIILCGYNWSGCRALEYLLKKKYQIYVYTHKSNFFDSDLEVYCKKNKIKYSLKKITKINLPFKPDLIISIFYRFKIPEDVLRLSKYKPFNLHPSLLPKYRGCSSLTWAIINNEKNSGFSYHYMEKTIDTGNIIMQKKIEIKKYDLQSTLYYRVMFESLKYFPKILTLVFKKTIGKKQIGIASYYGRGAPYNGIIKNNWSNKRKENFIRAMIFPPRKLSKYKNKFIKDISELKA
jgi:methionyl-tRNA formyltransferase